MVRQPCDIRGVALVAAPAAHLSARREPRPRRDPGWQQVGDRESGDSLGEHAVRAPPAGRCARGGRRLLHDQEVRPHQRPRLQPTGDGARLDRDRHRRRGRQVLLPQSQPARPRPAHRRHTVHSHRHHRASGESVRPVPRQNRDRTVQLADAAAHQPAW